MPCTNESCASTDGLEICLFCGHSFCVNHRGEQDGLAACTGCLKAAHDQRAAKPRPAAAASPTSPVSGSASGSASGSGSGSVQVQIAPPPMLSPEPWVAPWAALAAAPAAAYLWWFLGWLGRRHDLPGWLRPAGTVVGALLVFAGVWVIAKSRMTPTSSE